MTLHQNLIAGEWVGGDGVANINPSEARIVSVFESGMSRATAGADFWTPSRFLRLSIFSPAATPSASDIF
ncbi:UNVERIFIED_ORG: hypothetical protein J2W85_005996 [Ensifer adhaerens]|nr:hypothetical protein [Ensifer adhaerens]